MLTQKFHGCLKLVFFLSLLSFKIQKSDDVFNHVIIEMISFFENRHYVLQTTHFNISISPLF